MPRQQIDDADRVDRPGQGCKSGIGAGGVHRLDQQGGRFDAVVDRRGAVDVLAGADDHRSARVGGHRSERYEVRGSTGSLEAACKS